MKQQDIDQFLFERPITYDSVRVDFVDSSFKVGFFENLVGDFNTLRQKINGGSLKKTTLWHTGTVKMTQNTRQSSTETPLTN